MHYPITQMHEQLFIYVGTSLYFKIEDILMAINLCANPIMVHQNSNLS